MHLSTHYYVISLSEHTNALYEVFRDVVIDIRNGGFPLEVWLKAPSAADFFDREIRLLTALRTVDQHFSDCYRNDPLKLIVIGTKELQELFTFVTANQNAIIGRVEGEFSTTSLYDLGKIVWPVVKVAISGMMEVAMGDLEKATKECRTVCGLEAVSQLAVTGVSATLLVEDEYHVRGSINKIKKPLEISEDMDVMTEMDDAVDVVIEKVLESGGHVIFMPTNSLQSLGRIVLIS